MFYGYLLPENLPYVFLIHSIALFFIFYKWDIKRFICNDTNHNKYIFYCVSTIVCHVSIYSINSMKAAIVRSIIMLIGALFCLYGNWYENGIIFIFASIHVFFTIFLLGKGYFSNSNTTLLMILEMQYYYQCRKVQRYN